MSKSPDLQRSLQNLKPRNDLNHSLVQLRAVSMVPRLWFYVSLAGRQPRLLF